MGSRVIQRLSDEQIVAEYVSGKSQGWIGLKARISCAKVRAVLVANNIHIRGQAESLRLALRARRR